MGRKAYMPCAYHEHHILRMEGYKKTALIIIIFIV